MEHEGVQTQDVSNTDELTPLQSNSNNNNNSNVTDNISKFLGEIESANAQDNVNGQPPRQMWGIVLVLLSVCAYTCYTLIAKNLLAYRGVPYIQIVFTRSMITWLIDLLWIQWYRKQGESFSYFGERGQHKWLIVRSLGCFGANFLWIWSLLWLTPGDSDTIWQINAFWVLISAHFILGEKMDFMSWFCVCLGITGVILIAQPSFIFHTINNEYTSELKKWIGILLVLFSTLSYTVHVLIVRAKSLSIHWLQFEFFTATLATWVFIPLVGIGYFLAHYLMWNDASRAILSVYDPWISYSDWLEVVSLGIVGCLATATLTRGTQLAQARWVSIIMYSEVPLAYIGQVVIYHLYADIITWIGAAIVLTAVLIPSLREIYLESMKPKSNIAVSEDEYHVPKRENVVEIEAKQNNDEEYTPLLSRSQNNNV